ncbi:lipid-binding SYLF domain-containing protein [uncultured Paludibaculum sp.]|uniref:lipid-binding SYLF domain-containing protein n=1 Tax=uncultured Paludibaculum sp. TaxID=1765020 RepID=UPI002AABC779|nr:lipid-binding SYLF domain-containing protein [uncultured Paludibaculum sp.]
MKKCLLAVLAVSSLWAGEAENKRLEEASAVLGEIMDTGDKAIPQDLFSKAQCAVIVPALKKGGFILGAKYGRGFAACRDASGKGWTAPVGVRVEGGSVGFQIGGAESDVIMLVMSQKGMERLLSSKFTLGGEATVAAGPVGRDTTAQTDATMRAEILSWSRSRGVFGGIALQGATLRGDEDVDTALYGTGVDRKAVLQGKKPVPEAAKGLIAKLNKYSGFKGN